MRNIFLVWYYFTYEDEEKSSETSNVIAAFDTYVEALQYLRKFYVGEENDTKKYSSYYFKTYENKDGRTSADVGRSYKEGGAIETETLSIKLINVNSSTNPFTELKERNFQ